MKAEKKPITRLVKTAKGQLEGVLKMIEEDRYCLDISHQLMAAQAMRAGTSADTVRQLLTTNTTEEAVGILKETGDLEETVSEAIRRIQFYLQKHVGGELRTEVVLFSNQYGYLGESRGAEALMKLIAAEKQKLYRV